MGKRNLKYTTEEVGEIVNCLGFELLNKYINNKTKLILKDKDEYLYTPLFSSLLKGSLPERFGLSNIYTVQNIKLWCRLNNKPFELIDDQIYKGNTKQLQWHCFKEDCGDIFTSNWNNIFEGKGCGVCNGTQVGTSNCLAILYPKLIKEWNYNKNIDIVPSDFTASSNVEVWWVCKKGHDFYAKICNRSVRGDGCPYCSGRYATKENNLLLDNPELCKEWDYNKNAKSPEEYTPNSDKEVWWKCKDCNHEWSAQINSRNGNNKNGCPECNNSKGEKKIKKWAEENMFVYDKQYSFDGLVGLGGGTLLYDVPIFWDVDKNNLRLLIEYDGEGHYSEKPFGKKSFKSTQAHDIIKNEYCILHTITLIRIPYWDFDNIETILDNILNKNNMDSKYIVNNHKPKEEST